MNIPKIGVDGLKILLQTKISEWMLQARIWEPLCETSNAFKAQQSVCQSVFFHHIFRMVTYLASGTQELNNIKNKQYIAVQIVADMTSSHAWLSEKDMED